MLAKLASQNSFTFFLRFKTEPFGTLGIIYALIRLAVIGFIVQAHRIFTAEIDIE